MKTTLFILAYLANAALASTHHLDINIPSEEYREMLKTADINFTTETSVETGIRLGERLLKWIEHENKQRSSLQQLKITSKETRKNHPIEKPAFYNPKTIQAALDSLMTDMPESMKQVLNNKMSFPTSLTMNDDVFIQFARKLDRIYQTSARYKILIEHKDEFISRRLSDVRGYHYLKNNNWDKNKAKDLSQLDGETLATVKKSVYGICLNTLQNEKKCKTKVDAAIAKNQLASKIGEWMEGAKDNWDRFFQISILAERSDLVWKSSNPNIMEVPFNRPQEEKFVNYLKNNIEAEWKWDNWQLRINFGNFPKSANLKFEAGAVPHVNYAGGNELIMDANQSIEEDDSKLVIRHEFGHILGFPDCYHEFYDTELDGFVNYQLDTTDIMCSGTGAMTERMYKELKRVYFK